MILGANVNEDISTLSDKYPQVICVDGVVVESFLFNYFEFFQSKDGFQVSAFDFHDESKFVHLTVKDVESFFRIQFSQMRIAEFDSVNHFLLSIQNVIRFADLIQADDLLKKIVDLILSFDLSDFSKFWDDFRSIFAEYDEDNNIVTVNPQYVKLSEELHSAAIFRNRNNRMVIYDIQASIEKDKTSPLVKRSSID